MSWPQWVMIAVLLVGIAGKWVDLIRNRKLSSAGATFVGFAWAAYFCAFAGLLHAGGFW